MITIGCQSDTLSWCAPGMHAADARVQVWIECGGMLLRQGYELVAQTMAAIPDDGATLQLVQPDMHLAVTLLLRPDAGGVRAECVVANQGDAPLQLQRIIIELAAPGVLDDPQSHADWRVYVDSGSNAWCGVKRLAATLVDANLQMVETQRVLPVDVDGAAGRRFHSSSMLTALWDAATRRAYLVGFLGTSTIEPCVEVVPDPAAEHIAALRACAVHDAYLPPHASLTLDPFIILAGADPLVLLEQYAGSVRDRLNAQRSGLPVLAEQPIVGYMSWYGYGTAITEDIIRENAGVCREVFDGYPQPMRMVMLIDHGWQWHANWGKWDATDPRRFPSGMPALADQLKRMGLELGLWYTPFCITDDAPNARLRPLLACDDNGQPLSGRTSVWGFNPEEREASRDIFFLDSALPETLQEITDNLSRMKSWGASFWKLDFFTVVSSASRAGKCSSAALYDGVDRAIQSALGLHDLVMPCSTQTNQLLGKCNLINIPCDTGNASMWPSRKDSFRRSYETTAAAWFKHDVFWVNDNQSVQLGEGCSHGEARIRATHIAMSGAGCWLSEDATALPSDRLMMLQRLLPVYGKAACPLDLFERVYPAQSPRLWALTVKTNWDEWTVLAVFNFDAAPFHCELGPSIFDIAGDAAFEAMEWWTSRRLGQHTGALAVDVPPEDVAIILAKPVRPTPWLLGTDLHFTGGWIMENVMWDAERLTLQGDIVTKAGLLGNLYGMQPPELTIRPSVTQAARDNGNGGWHMRIKTSGTHTHFEVPFSPR